MGARCEDHVFRGFGGTVGRDAGGNLTVFLEAVQRRQSVCRAPGP